MNIRLISPFGKLRRMLPGKTFLFLALYILVSLAASDENAELDAIVEKLASSSSLLSGISLQNGLIDGSINPDHAIAAMMGMETVDMGKLEKFDGGTIMDYFKTLRDVAPDYSQVEDVPRQLAMILREYEQVEALQTARVKRIAIGDLTSAAKSVGNVLDTSPFNALGQTVGGAVGLFNDIRNFPNTSLSGVAGNAADTLKGLHGALTGVTNLASGVSKAIDDLKKLPGFGLIWKGLAMTPKGRLLITAKKLFDKINLLKNMIPTDFNDFVDKMKNLPNFFKDLIPEEFSDVMSVFNCVTDWMSPFNSDKIKCEKKKSENQNQNQNQDPNNNNNNNSPSPSSSPSSSPSNPLSNPIGSIDNAVKKAKEALRDAIRPDSSPSKGKNMDKADRIQKNLRNWSPSPSGSGSGGGGGGGSGGGGGLPIPGIPLPSASIPFSTGIPGIGLGGGGGGGSGGGGGGGGGGGSGGSGGGGSGGSSGGSGGSSGSGIGVDLPSLPGLGDLDNIFSALFNLIPTGLLTGPNPLGAAIKGIDAASKVADGLSSVLPNVPGVTAAITGLFPNLPIGGVVDPSHLAGPLKDLLDALPSPADVDQMTPKQVEDAIMNIKTLPAFIPVAEKIDELEAPLDVIVDGLDRADLRVNLGILADPAEKVKMENFDSDGAVKTYFTTLKDSADGIKKALAAVDLIGELRDLKDDDQFFKDILAVGSGIKEATKEIKKTRDTVSTIVKNADKIPSDVKFDGLKNIQPDSRAVSDAVEVVKGVVKAAKGKEHIETLIKEGGKVATAIEKIPDPVVKAEVKKLWGDFDKTKTALNKFKDQVDEKKKEIVKAAKENPMFDSTLDPSKKSTLPQRPSGNRATPPNGLNPPPNPTNPANPPVNPSDSTSTTAASNPSGPVTNPTSRPDVINPVGPADSSSTTSSQVVTSNTNPADSSTPDHTLVNPTNPPASQNPSGSPDVPSLPNPSNPWDADIHIPTGPPITDAIPANLADLGDIFTKAIGIQPVDINFADRAKALGLLITHLPPVNVSFPSADAFDIENVLRSLENVNDINPGTFGGADGLLSSIPAILDKVDTSVKGVQQEAEGSEELKRWREEVKERMTPEQRERERKMEEERESRRKDHLYFVKKSLRFREMWMVSEPREAESMERSMCRIVKEKSKEGNGLVTVASYKMGPPEKMEKRSDTGFDLVFEGCQWIRLWISSNKNMSAYTLEQNVENSLDFNFHLNWFSDGERIDGILENVYRVRFVFPRNETMKPQLEFHRKNSTISDRHVLNLPVDYTRHWFHLIKAPYCVADFKAPSIYDEVEKATNDKRTEKEMLEESLHSVKPWVDPLVPQRCSLGSFVPIGAPIEEKVS